MSRLATVKADWAARGFSCDIWTDPPGRQWIDFVHDVDELVMLDEGELELTFHGQTLRPRPGEEVFIPAGARHSVRNPGVGENRWFYGYRRR